MMRIFSEINFCRKFFLTLLLGGILTPAKFVAQESAETLNSIDFIRHSEAWLSSENAAGLGFLPIDKISLAEVNFGKGDGKFVNYYQSPNYLFAGAKAESFLRLGEKSVFYGAVDYDNFTGKAMRGSVFINPYDNTFDIIEVTPETEGRKKRETYHLIGAYSYNIAKNLSLGGKFDYLTANYAKDKDLRHSNSLLDFSISIGGCYNINERISLGINYFYQRRVEGVSFRTYGTTDRQYSSLISFGAAFGRREMFGEDGYTDSSNDNPAVNTLNGGALQFVFHPSQSWKWFNEISYRKRDGYFGKRSNYTPVYLEHNGTNTSYKGVLSYSANHHRHDVSVNLNRETLKNYENIFRRETDSGNRTTIVYFGNNQALDRTRTGVSLDYSANLFLNGFQPVWLLSAGADYDRQMLTSSVFPWYRKQEINIYSFRVSGQRHIEKGKNGFDISLAVKYGFGSGNAANDGAYQGASDSQTQPRTDDDFLYREYEYLTAKQISASAGFRYSRLINANLRGFAGLNFNYAHAFSQEISDARQRQIFCLKIGCFF